MASWKTWEDRHGRFCHETTRFGPLLCGDGRHHLVHAENVEHSPRIVDDPPASRPNCAAPPVPTDASPPPSALPQRRLPSIPPRRLRPPARSMRPACEDRDAPAKPPSAHHRSTPTPPSESSLESIQTEPTLHRFESHPRSVCRKTPIGRLRGGSIWW